jgi:uncharacterized protein (TIGR00369 family)
MEACTGKNCDVRNLYKRIVAGGIGQPPQAQTLGYYYTEMTAEKVVAVFPADRRHYNPYGWVGGGALSMVCDEAMGILCDLNLSDIELPKTIEYKINFYRPIQQSILNVTATFRKKGRRISHLECLVTEAQDREVALAMCTMMVTPCECKVDQWTATRMTASKTSVDK